jgi:hypothetical protein
LAIIVLPLRVNQTSVKGNQRDKLWLALAEGSGLTANVIVTTCPASAGAAQKFAQGLGACLVGITGIQQHTVNKVDQPHSSNRRSVNERLGMLRDQSIAKKSLRWLSFPVWGCVLLSPVLMDCSSLPPGLNRIPGCPDTTSVSAIAKVDWAKELNLKANVAERVKAGLQASVNIQKMAFEIDGELKAACSNIAKDLGKDGSYKDGPEACKAAASAIQSAKAKLGAGARVVLAIKPPHCAASMDAMAKCSGSCDASVSGGEAKVKCEPGKLSGECSGKCSGSCELESKATCEGTCKGSCSAGFRGSCTGTCKGKCNGKSFEGECQGRCEGECSGTGEGSCSGGCKGECKLSGRASCRGTCTGSCSVEFKAPKCTGEMTPPKVSAECKGRCESEVNAEVKCTPAQVGIRIDGKANAEAAAKFKATLEANLPAVLKIAIGMKSKGPKLAAQITATLQGVKAAATASVKGGGGAKVALCVGKPVAAAIQAAANVQANVNVSVNVQASASGSASGKAGGK